MSHNLQYNVNCVPSTGDAQWLLGKHQEIVFMDSVRIPQPFFCFFIFLFKSREQVIVVIQSYICGKMTELHTHTVSTRSISNWRSACWTHPFILHSGTTETAGPQPRPRAPSLGIPAWPPPFPTSGEPPCVCCSLVLTSLALTSQPRTASKVVN